jgi:PAS domain S-box-containing protein
MALCLAATWVLLASEWLYGTVPMAEPPNELVWLENPRLAGHATAATPLWVWRADGQRILWANGAAVALAGVCSARELASRSFAAEDEIARRIAHLADTLPENGSPRLVTLPAAGDAAPRNVLCSRLMLDDAIAAVLVIATERMRPAPSLSERVRLLIGASDAPLAAFTAAGQLLYATPAAKVCLGGSTTVGALGADNLAANALADGHAEGNVPGGRLLLDRIGRGESTVLLATFSETFAASPETDAAGSSAGQPLQRPSSRRFTWEMDEDGRFTITSPDFIERIGPGSASVLGRPWIDIAAQLALDPEDRVSRAIESQETWSGIPVLWPVNHADERLRVELSGLPTFDRERTFRGYRGFGVYRDLDLPQADFGAAAPTEVAAAAEQATDGDATGRPPPELSPVERTAFRELARQLSVRLAGGAPEDAGEAAEATEAAALQPVPMLSGESQAGASDDGVRAILDRLPLAVLVYRADAPIYANRAFLAWSGDADLDAFAASGGVDRLFRESGVIAANDECGATAPVSGASRPAMDSRLFCVSWNGERAQVLALLPKSGEQAREAALRQSQMEGQALQSALALASDGFAVLDAAGRVIRIDAQAEALFGGVADPVAGRSLVELLAADDRAAVAADFAVLVTDSDKRHEGREVAVRCEGRHLLLRLGRLADEEGQSRYGVAFRDISRWKQTEQDLLAAKRQAEQASRAKSDFIAKISHEIRTPLNAIIGFSEVMMEERLGPVENDRYRAYLKDIHASGEHLVALLNDLLDLSKIEAGKLQLKFGDISLNELTRECVGLMQPQANRGRVIIRTSLAAALPPIVADARSVRQILLNLMSNSIKFTGAGGQVIVSTTATDHGEAVLRVRDTGIGMSEQEIATALEPFRQLETSAREGSSGTGLGLPLTKALVEANRAHFAIKSAVDSGTLVEVAFPTSQLVSRMRGSLDSVAPS